MTTTGYTISTGADLITLFAPYVSGPQANPTEYKLANGDDLSTMFAPYVSGTQVALTEYKLANGNDISTVFAPAPPPVSAFPTAQASVPGIGNFNSVSMDGANCVFATRGGAPSGNPYSYLYWSNDFGATLNKANINGSEQKFYGRVAISGQNAIAMGSLVAGSDEPTNFYLSTNAGQSYTVTSSTGQTTAPMSFEPFISIDGSNAVWGSYYNAPYYSSNAGASWTVSTGGSIYASDIKIYGNNAYLGTYGAFGFYYSTNKGQSYTKHPTINGSCITKCGSNLYIAAPGNIYKSTDNGVTVTTIMAQNIGQPSSITSFPGTNGDFVWISTQTKNYYTNNANSSGTVTWTEVANGILYSNASAANGTRMIAGSNNTNIYWGRNAYIT